MPKTRRSTTCSRGVAPPPPHGRGRGAPLPIPLSTSRGCGHSRARGFGPSLPPPRVNPSLSLGDVQALIRQDIGQALAAALPPVTSASSSTAPTNQVSTTAASSERTVCCVVSLMCVNYIYLYFNLHVRLWGDCGRVHGWHVHVYVVSACVGLEVSSCAGNSHELEGSSWTGVFMLA